MARRYKRDSRGRFAGSGGGTMTRTGGLGAGPVKGTIAKSAGKRAARLQSGKGGSGFGEGSSMPRRVGAARDAVVARKGLKDRAAERRFEKKQGWRGSEYSGKLKGAPYRTWKGGKEADSGNPRMKFKVSKAK